MPQLSNRKLPLNKTLAWRPRPKESCLRWEKIITSVLIPCAPPRRLGWTRYHDADQHWHRIVEHLRCGLKNLKKNIDLFFSLFLFKGVWKFLVSNIFWSPPISWWLQWLQNCQPPSFWEKRNLYSQRVAYSRCIRGSEVSPTSFTGLI